MNETAKLAAYKQFKTTVLAIAAEIGAIAKPNPRAGEGVWNLALKNDKAVELEFTYGSYKQPTVYFDNGKPVTNLSSQNLKAHIVKRLAARRAQLAEYALDDLKDEAKAKAEKQMVQFLNTVFTPYGFHPTKMDVDTPAWNSPKGWIKLALITVTGTAPKNFVMSYNFEYEFETPAAQDIDAFMLKGEIESTSIHRILRYLRAIIETK